MDESFLSIPNFCLGPQPSGIPLTFAWIAFRFSTHWGSLYRLWTYFFFFFNFSLVFFSFPSYLLSLFLFPFPKMAIWEAPIASSNFRIYKKWLRAVMKWVHIGEKAYKKSNQLKDRRTDRPPWYAPNLTFLHLMILMSFLMNLIKDWSVLHPL